MISRVSGVIAKWLLQAGAISAEDLDLYIYGIYSFLFTITPLSLVVLLSLPLNMPLEGILLIVPFILLRKFAGGFHFKSALPCAIVSTFLLLFFLFGIKFTLLCEKQIAFSILVYLSLIIIITLSPIDSENRKLSKLEKKFFHKVSIVLSALFTLLYTLFMLSSLNHIAIPTGAGIMLTALLQIPCLIQNRFLRKTKRSDKGIHS